MPPVFVTALVDRTGSQQPLKHMVEVDVQAFRQPEAPVNFVEYRDTPSLRTSPVKRP